MKKTKEKYHHGNLKTQMINEAIEEMSNGLNLRHIKIKDIAQKLNVTSSATYRHFKDLNDFHFQIILTALKNLYTLLNNLEDSNALIEEYVHFAYNNPSLYQASFQNNLKDEDVLSLKKDLILSLNKFTKEKVTNQNLELFAILHGMSSVAILLKEQNIPFNEAYQIVLEPYKDLIHSIL